MTFKPSAKKQLEKARAAQAETDQKRDNIRSRRGDALLASDDTGPIIAFDQELAELDRIAKARGDRIEALKGEVEKEEGLARAKRDAAFNECIKAETAEADAIGAEAQAVIDQLVKLYF